MNGKDVEKGASNLAFEDEDTDVRAKTREQFQLTEAVIDENVDDPTIPSNGCGQFYEDALQKCHDSLTKLNENLFSILLRCLVIALYFIFLVIAVNHHFRTGKTFAELDWCSGQGFIILVTLILAWSALYYKVIVPQVNLRWPGSKLSNVLRDAKKSYGSFRYSGLLSYAVILVPSLIWLVIDSLSDDARRLRSLLGLALLLLTGFLISSRPGKIRWRPVISGILLQYALGLVIFRWPAGRNVVTCFGDKIQALLSQSDKGSGFVFGYLVDQKPVNLGALNRTGVAHQVFSEVYSTFAFNSVFYFKVLSVIYFFAFLVAIVFHLGAIQWLVEKLGWLLQVTIGTTACESVTAAANVFLGPAPSALMVKPYLCKMTPSELHAVMTSGFATIAGSVLAAYISFGISPAHLLSASFMSAPAALAISKLVMPETRRSKTSAENLEKLKPEHSNLLEAAQAGAIEAVSIVGNVAGTLIAITAFVALVNLCLTWAGSMVGVDDLTVEWVLGQFFIPLSYCLGVPSQDLEKVGTLIGLKTFANEFVAYSIMKDMVLEPRSKVIATYALCGFSNPAALGLQIAILGTMAPNKRADLASVGLRAFVSGSMACFMTAAVAGSLLGS